MFWKSNLKDGYFTLQTILNNQGDWIKNDAVVIDAGYHPEQCGDIDLDQVINRSLAYTPVPGGVGPMTINTLILQTVEACENS